MPYNNKPGSMRTIIFYTKDGCPICKEAENLLDELKISYGLHINKTDITVDKKIFEKYKYEVPVIIFEDGSILSGRIEEGELKECLK